MRHIVYALPEKLKGVCSILVHDDGLLFRVKHIGPCIIANRICQRLAEHRIADVLRQIVDILPQGGNYDFIIKSLAKINIDAVVEQPGYRIIQKPSSFVKIAIDNLGNGTHQYAE